MDDFNIEGTFPTIITPKKQKITFKDFCNQLTGSKTLIEKLLLQRGALLFRDFPINSPDDFANFIETINLGNFVNYIAGDSPRDKVKNKVYTSTEAPPALRLPLHQELSYIKNFPSHIYFYCEIPPVEKGETIIADARKVYQHLDPELIKLFDTKGLTYISRYHGNDKILDLINRFQRSHKTWMEVFETSEKSNVEKLCKENDIDLTWLTNGWLEMKQKRPAITKHPITQETVWFNQAHLYDFNPKLLGMMRYLGTKILYSRPSTKLHEITFSDGSAIPRDYLYHIIDVLNKNTVAYPWKKNDVMMLDNVLAMHGRAPFSGKRRVLTALTK